MTALVENGNPRTVCRPILRFPFGAEFDSFAAMKRTTLTHLILAGALLSGCASQSLSSHGGWYTEQGGRVPVGDKLYICHAFSCALTTPVTLNAAELTRIRAPFRRSIKNAEAERAAVSDSVQIFEEIIGARVGTSGDRGGLDIGGGDPGQLDCIDEATNTTSLLLLLTAKGDLKYHEVRRPVARGFLLDGRYPHATAVLREKDSDKSWAIDSWRTANAKPPVIQDLDVWIVSRGSG